MKNLRLHVWNFISTKLTDRSSILWNTLHIFGSQALLTFKINSLKFFAIKWLYMKNLKLYYLKILKVKYFILTDPFVSLSLLFSLLLDELLQKTLMPFQRGKGFESKLIPSGTSSHFLSICLLPISHYMWIITIIASERFKEEEHKYW